MLDCAGLPGPLLLPPRSMAKFTTLSPPESIVKLTTPMKPGTALNCVGAGPLHLSTNFDSIDLAGY